MYIIRVEENSDNYAYTLGPTHKIRIEPQEKPANQEYLITVIQSNKLVLEVYIGASSNAIEPGCIVVENQLYIGIEHCIAVVNLITKELKKIELETVFFNFLVAEKKSLIIAVCEADLLFLSKKGEILRIQTLSDIITDAKLVKGKLLQVTLFEGDNLDIVL